jgi:DNA-binding LacI/PurR family transcriptional regulator
MEALTPRSDKRITIRELAEMAGTTYATVSRALSGKPGVSDRFREEIVQLAKKHHYVPNQLARTLQKGGSPFLGFLAADLTNFTYIGIFRQLEALCREKGFALLIADSEQRPELEREHLEYFLRMNVRGAFVFPVSDWQSNFSNEHFDTLLSNRIPIVAMGHISRPGISTVISEEKLNARKLIAELHALGHKRFLIVAQEDHGNIPATIRLKSMTEAISALDGGHLTEVVQTGASLDWKGAVVRAIQRRNKRPTAIVTINENAALALYQPLAVAGIRIPEDVSLATCGSCNWIEEVAFPLTSSHINIESVATAAQSLLFEKMNNPDAPDEHLIIAQSILLKESVAKVSG